LEFIAFKILGTPLPIWRTEDGKEEFCIGSVEELKAEVDKSVKAGFMKRIRWLLILTKIYRMKIT